eukprot:Phypoly_transcript_31297.p1 GENE.Phypoly_transcript_31297~~Phypoly_transcript_31297.p1  ORF type:complete len:101 (+),score=6.67 Phypoly_transcript_31297:36-305(+)
MGYTSGLGPLPGRTMNSGGGHAGRGNSVDYEDAYSKSTFNSSYSLPLPPSPPFALVFPFPFSPFFLYIFIWTYGVSSVIACNPSTKSRS